MAGDNVLTMKPVITKCSSVVVNDVAQNPVISADCDWNLTEFDWPRIEACAANESEPHLVRAFCVVALAARKEGGK